MLRERKKPLSSFRIIIFGFAGLILLGALLLCLPISSQSGEFTSFWDSLFTSTSAVCVTGLIVKDTATYWSSFGQAVILTLIQIGGLGVITLAVSFSFVSGRKIGLKQRSTLQDAISAPQVGGIIRLTRFFLKWTVIVELLGALLLMPVFIPDYGFKGIWYSFFHSISAFCNAGFDLMGNFSSLSSLESNPLLNVVIMLLIIIGGIGFLTWHDIKLYKFKIKKYRMQSKVILSVSALLILLPAIFNFFFEYSKEPINERILHSLFQSVTARTAGFNTADLTLMSSGGIAIMILLMLVGGSPGSTAGGMKTTTVGVLFISAFSVFKRKKDAEAFGRRIPLEAIRNAAAILFIYVFLFLGSAVAISIIEGIPLKECLFESASAIGTVGLSLGITPSLSLASHIILMFLMFFGRVGGLTMIYAVLTTSSGAARLPEEKITVG